jgi:hypothetical protein
MGPYNLRVTSQTIPVTHKPTKPTLNQPLILIVKQPEEVFALAE